MTNEHNISFPPFYVGQKVVAVRDANSGISFKKGDIRTVLAIIKCRCGIYCIDVGDPYLKNRNNTVTKCSCGHGISSDRLLAYASAFAPLHEAKFPLISYSKVLEEVETGSN